MFGHAEAQTVRLPYANFVSRCAINPTTITKIDPEAKRVITDEEAIRLIIWWWLCGADYDWNATPGLAKVNKVYTTAGAERLRDALPNFTRGHALIGVLRCAVQCRRAQRMRAHATRLPGTQERKGGLRVSFVLPLPTPVPPSPETSKALVAAFAERNIKFYPSKRVMAINATHGSLSRRPLRRNGFRPVPWRTQTPCTVVVLDCGSAEAGGQQSIRVTLEPSTPASMPSGTVQTQGRPRQVYSPKVRQRL